MCEIGAGNVDIEVWGCCRQPLPADIAPAGCGPEEFFML
jgi:hypothetical protein